MKKYVIILLVLSPFVYAYYHKPLIDAHREKIYVTAKGGETAYDEEAAALPMWDGLDFVDWTVFTATREKTLYSLVSFGLLEHVFVLDKEWAPKIMKLTAKSPS